MTQRMAGIVIYKFMKWTPLIQVLLLSLGTLISFIIALSKGHVNFYLPFISETGAFSPEMCIFSLFLILGSFIGFFIVFCRFMLFSQIEDNITLTRINYLALYCGLMSMLGLAGVAAFPMTTVFWAHLVAAGMYFLGSALYFLFATLTTLKVEGKTKMYTVRSILTVVLLVLLVILLIFFPISLKTWHDSNSIIPALKEPENEGFTLVLISAILEWSIVLIIIIFILSFMYELNNHGLLLSIISIKNENDSEVEASSRVAENSP